MADLLADEVEAAETECELDSGNSILSCFPTADTVYVQHQFASFVWNSRLPAYAETNLVNIYLLDADTGGQILELANVSNPVNEAGVVTMQVNDSWWGDLGANWSGENTSYAFYFMITPNTETMDTSVETQTHFVAVQTTILDSLPVSTVTVSTTALTGSKPTDSGSPTTSTSIPNTQTNSIPHPHTSAGILTGSIVGGVFGIIVMIALLFLFLRRKSRRIFQLPLGHIDSFFVSPKVSTVTAQPRIPTKQLLKQRAADMRQQQQDGVVATPDGPENPPHIRGLAQNESNIGRSGESLEDSTREMEELRRQNLELISEIADLRAMGVEVLPPYASDRGSVA